MIICFIFFYCKNLVAWALFCYTEAVKFPVFLLDFFFNVAKEATPWKNILTGMLWNREAIPIVKKERDLHAVCKFLLPN